MIARRLPIPTDEELNPTQHYLTQSELLEIDEQLELLERGATTPAPKATPTPEPEQQTLTLEVAEAKSFALFALFRSPLESERKSAFAIVRRALERTKNPVAACKELGASERWIQTLIKNNPSLCQGIEGLKRPGRPRTKPPKPPKTPKGKPDELDQEEQPQHPRRR